MSMAEYKLKASLYRSYNRLGNNAHINKEDLESFIDTINKEGMSFNDIKYFIGDHKEFSVYFYDQYYNKLDKIRHKDSPYNLYVMCLDKHAKLMSKEQVDRHKKYVKDGVALENCIERNPLNNHLTEINQQNKRTYLYSENDFKQNFINIFNKLIKEEGKGKYLIEIYADVVQINHVLLNDGNFYK